MEVRYHESLQPFGLYATLLMTKQSVSTIISKGSFAPKIVELRFGGDNLRGETSIMRYLARSFSASLYGGNDALQSSSIDQWIDSTLTSNILGSLKDLDAYIESNTFLVGRSLTLADISLWGYLKRNNFNASTEFKSLGRWFALVDSFLAPSVLTMSIDTKIAGKAGKIEKSGNADDKKSSKKSNETEASDIKNGGKDVPKGFSSAGLKELENAVVGKVVTRFPPEPSGYLHIGHCKALMLNWEYAKAYEGKMILRFDDTNPEKEKGEYADSFIRDIERLNIKPDLVTHTSDHFDLLNDYAIRMIKEGKAFMDDTDVDEMRKERMEHINSKHRNASVEANLENYAKMHSGLEGGDKWCMRAKIDMSHANGTLRDPVLYRANYEDAHVRTGTKYKAYPTYDFACPIVDSIEGVTHAMRTTEYNDRAAQYEWVIQALGLRPVNLQEFARMSFQYTLMSKRKLQVLVDNKAVDGWNDPRFPTIQGALRRGVTVQCLKDFVVSQGFSKRLVDMEWDKFWSVNNKIIDASAERHMAIFKDNAIVLHLTNVTNDSAAIITSKHPKNPDMGNKVIPTGPFVYLEREDIDGLKANDEIVLMRWGVVKLTEIQKDSNGVTTGAKGEYVPNGDFKNKETRKLSWVVKSEHNVSVNMIEFDHLITKPKLEPEDDWNKYLTKVTKVEAPAIGDAALRLLQENQVIQLERRGFYRVDSVYVSPEKPLILFMIPDGKKKAMSTLSFKLGHH